VTPLGALDLKFHCGDLDRDLTIRDYLKELLETLFRETEGFSGKRPFGNSGWDYDLAKPLIEVGCIAGRIDEYGYAEEFDEAVYTAFVYSMIRAL